MDNVISGSSSVTSVGVRRIVTRINEDIYAINLEGIQPR